MALPFTHLHVASGYSLRYGASTPRTLVEIAAGHGMHALALTDRDGLYGAVKFARACIDHGLRPILGVDLAVEPSHDPSGPGGSGAPGGGASARRSPVRGGAGVDPRHPRVTVLALGADGDGGREPGVGYGRLCRLVSATHLRGERGRPVSTPALIAEHAVAAPGGPAALAVLLGPESAVGRAVTAGRPDLARAVLQRWREVLPPGTLAVEVVCHQGPPGAPLSLGHAARMLSVAGQAGVPAVLTNAVRYATPHDAATVDVLDSARRLVPLDARHLDRVSAQGHLASQEEMAALAERVADAAGASASRLLATTQAWAERCLLDPGADLEMGPGHPPHLPATEELGLERGADVQQELRRRCEGGIAVRYPGAGPALLDRVTARLEDELRTVAGHGYAAYFITVGIVCDLIREMGVRVAARGSGAGSMVNHLLGISGVDPLRHGLLMERFLSPLRNGLPDIDVDVESARREEVYEQILQRFGAHQVSCISMMDTYRVRHAVRDAGAALGMPPAEVDAIATSFPHIRARDVRHALAELPELRRGGLDAPRLALLFDLVERLDGLPRHVAVHPCGILLSDHTLLDRTPVEASWSGFPMSQYDKDDVEDLNLLKLDVLGIRMQSAMAYAVREVARVDGDGAVPAGGHDPAAPYLDAATGLIDLDAVPHDDEATFRLIRTTRTLGCFQIESPGQRELVGKFGPRTFDDLVIDISLFRPGPVKSDMVTPFLMARGGWEDPDLLHPRLAPVLAPTHGVVVFHEQVLQIVAEVAGCSLAEADEVRRALGSPAGQQEVEAWLLPRARERGYPEETLRRIWEVLTAFASFGFCKAHAAAFALPTYHSAWLKAHHPAAFLAGVLTHDPGMYPKRLLLDDARHLGITVLPLDVNASDATYRVERVGQQDRVEAVAGGHADGRPEPDLPDGRPYGIRLSLADVKGIGEAEVARIVAGRPYRDLADFHHRAQVARPVTERLVLAGAFDSVHGIGSGLPVQRRRRVTRRDLLLQVAELDRWSRATTRAAGRVTPRRGRRAPAAPPAPTATAGATGTERVDVVRAAAARQSRAPAAAEQVHSVQLTLDLGDAPDTAVAAGLPELTGAERVRAELEVLGLDASRHVLDFYSPLLDALGVTRARDVLKARNRRELLVAGVKVATQTPPIRSGRRVVFLTLDDATGPVDATFFEDAQGPYAATVFHSWLLVVRGVLRRTGPRGVSLRATGAWELPPLWDAWTDGGLESVLAVIAAAPDPTRTSQGAGAAAGRAARPMPTRPPVNALDGGLDLPGAGRELAERAAAATGLPVGDRDTRDDGMGGGPGHRRVLVHASGFRQSPYADIKPAGEDARDTRRMLDAQQSAAREDQRRQEDAPPRRLWHASPGSSGR